MHRALCLAKGELHDNMYPLVNKETAVDDAKNIAGYSIDINGLIQELLKISHHCKPHTEVLVHTVYPENMGEHVLPISQVSKRQFTDKGNRGESCKTDVIVLTGKLYNKQR